MPPKTTCALMSMVAGFSAAAADMVPTVDCQGCATLNDFGNYGAAALYQAVGVSGPMVGTDRIWVRNPYTGSKAFVDMDLPMRISMIYSFSVPVPDLTKQEVNVTWSDGSASAIYELPVEVIDAIGDSLDSEYKVHGDEPSGAQEPEIPLGEFDRLPGFNGSPWLSAMPVSLVLECCRELRRRLLQPIDGRVFSVDVVSDFRFRQTFFWRSDRGFGTTSRGDLAYGINLKNVLRWEAFITTHDETEGGQWYAGQTWYHLVAERSAFSLRSFIRGETGAESSLKEYGIDMIYRRPFTREWLYLSVGPSVTWPKEVPEDRREMSLGFNLWLEMEFGNWRY